MSNIYLKKIFTGVHGTGSSHGVAAMSGGIPNSTAAVLRGGSPGQRHASPR